MIATGSPVQVGGRTALTAARGAVGGVLMGLANLVPGISGGTMLLAVGVYPQVVRSVAEVSTFRLRLRSLLLLAAVAAGAVVAVVGLAGLARDLVVQHQWVMYSLFIGLTLGGVPLLWRMVRPADATVIVAAAVGLLAMIALAVLRSAPAGTIGGGEVRPVMLVVAGAAGGAAMVLPGISGGYLLLVLGQYEIVLNAIDAAGAAATAGRWAELAAAMRVIVPLGIGVVAGVVGIANLVRLCLDRFPRPTLGVLLGLLVGAVAGLWPFREPVSADGGDAPRTADWTTWHLPDPGPGAAAIALVAAGFAVSAGIALLGGSDVEGAADPQAGADAVGGGRSGR